MLGLDFKIKVYLFYAVRPSDIFRIMIFVFNSFVFNQQELYEALEKQRPKLFRLASDTDENEADAISKRLCHLQLFAVFLLCVFWMFSYCTIDKVHEANLVSKKHSPVFVFTLFLVLHIFF